MDYPLGIEASVKKIFAGVLVGAIKEDNPQFQQIALSTKINYNRFVSMFPSNIFQDEYAIFYSILVDKHIKLFTVDQLRSIVANNRDLILDSPYINIAALTRLQNGNQLTDDDKIEAIQATMVETFVDLSNRYVSEDEFNSAALIFIDWFRNQYMLETTQHMALIMSDSGYTEKKHGKRTVTYKGTQDCKKYYSERVNVLNEISDTDRIKTTVLDMDWYTKQKLEEDRPDEQALLTIGLKKVDDVVGELRRTNLIGILGPPKGGKTRFTNFLVQRALSLGLNVCVWPLEGTSEEWISMQIASYIARKYGVFLNSKDILRRRFETEQEKTLVRAAKLEMVMDKSYGRLSFIESTAYVEDFIEILDNHFENKNPFDVIVIDSLVNILSKTGRNKVDRISSAYMLLKSYISTGIKRPALAIVPAQLKQETVDFLRAHPNETIDVTSGGESAETIRSPDEVLGLFSSKEERAAGYMKIYSVASRHSENFSDFQVRTSLKCCHFYDE